MAVIRENISSDPAEGKVNATLDLDYSFSSHVSEHSNGNSKPYEGFVGGLRRLRNSIYLRDPVRMDLVSMCNSIY